MKGTSEATLGLAGAVKDLPVLARSWRPTGGDVLETSVLLANGRHLAETLAGEQAVLGAVVSNTDLRKAFQNALGGAAQTFGVALQQFDPWGLHLYLAWLWLQQVHGPEVDTALVEYGGAKDTRCGRDSKAASGQIWRVCISFRKEPPSRPFGRLEGTLGGL